MKTVGHFSCFLLITFAASSAFAQNKTVETRIGNLSFTHDFANGYPTDKTVEKLGMPSSGPRIVASIKKLRFKPEHIKLIINGHAHSDHAGGFAYMKELEKYPNPKPVRLTEFGK